MRISDWSSDVCSSDLKNFRGQALTEPLPTQTTENRFAIVNPLISPITHTGPGRYYLMDNQLPTITTAKRGELAMISPVYCQASSPTPSVNIDGGALIPLRRDTNPVELNGVVPALTGHSHMDLAIGTLAHAVEASPSAPFTPSTSAKISDA